MKLLVVIALLWATACQAYGVPDSIASQTISQPSNWYDIFPTALFGKVKTIRESSQKKNGSLKLLEIWEFDSQGRSIKKTEFVEFSQKEKVTTYKYSEGRLSTLYKEDATETRQYDSNGCLREHKQIDKDDQKYSFTNRYRCETVRDGIRRVNLNNSQLYDAFDAQGRIVSTGVMEKMFCFGGQPGRPCPDKFSEYVYKYGLSSDGSEIMIDKMSKGELESRTFFDKKTGEIIEHWGSLGGDRKYEYGKQVYEYADRDAAGNWTTLRSGYVRNGKLDISYVYKRVIEYW